jgi:hypothetical protein
MENFSVRFNIRFEYEGHHPWAMKEWLIYIMKSVKQNRISKYAL